MHFASRSRKSAVDWHELQRRETVGRGHVRKSMTERHRKEAGPLNDLANEEEARIRHRCDQRCGLWIYDDGTWDHEAKKILMTHENISDDTDIIRKWTYRPN